MRDFVPVHNLNRYRAHIDIDGRTNSWPGFFQKLLSGSPVLKVQSARRYRQWYYDRLRPWEHYVPVASDLTDLVDKAIWLLENDAQAQRIGLAGRAVADDMTSRGRTCARRSDDSCRHSWGFSPGSLSLHPRLREMSFQGTAAEIRSSLDNTQPAMRGQHSNWHNSYLTAALSKRY